MDTFPFPPSGSVAIGGSFFAFEVRDGPMVCFSNLEAFDCHDARDRPALRLRTAKFAECGVRGVELEAAFGVNRSTVQHAVNRLRSRGRRHFHAPRQGRGRSALDAATVREADPPLASGLGGAAARGPRVQVQSQPPGGGCRQRSSARSPRRVGGWVGTTPCALRRSPKAQIAAATGPPIAAARGRKRVQGSAHGRRLGIR